MSNCAGSVCRSLRSSFLALLSLFLFALSALSASGQAAVTGDSRIVTEPVYPAVCSVLTAVQTAGSLVETSPDTARVQAALNACAPGQAVEFSAAGTANAFIIQPITLPAGVTMLVDPEVTIFGSITSTDYACDPNFCTSLITVAPNTAQPGSGIMGLGVIDGRGGVPLTNTGAAWWADASKPRPRTVFLANHSDNTVSSDYFTMYKITIQNSPKFEFSGIGNNLTIWGVKILAPPDSPNTDGIDPSASTNITITKSFVSTGDDMIALKAGNGHVSNVTISNNHMYSGHGITVGSETNAGLNNMLVTDNAIDNGFGGSSLDSLRIKSDVSRGGEVKDVLYRNICINNGGDTIVLDPYYSNQQGTLIPNFHDIHFQNVRKLIHNSSYKSTFNGYNTGGTVFPLTVTMDNVVFDGDTQNDFAAPKQVNNAQFTLGPNPVSFASFLTVDAATASNFVTVTNNITTTAAPLDCSKAFIYIAGELTGPASPIAAGSSPVITAVVQNVVSPSIATKVAVLPQQNKPTGTVQLLEGTTVVGTAVLSGRLAYITISKITAGTHTYTANYMGDKNFTATPFGTFTLVVSGSGGTGTAQVNGSKTTVPYGTATATLTASIPYTGTAAPTGAVTFTVGGTGYPATCTAAAGTRTCNVTYTSATTAVGTYPISITEAADTTYTAANGSGSLVVTAVAPTIKFAVADHKSSDAPFTVAATSNSTGAFVYTVVSGPATIANNTVTLTGTGVVTLQATEAADVNYTTGSVQTTFNVTAGTPTAPTITFTPPNRTYGDTPFTVTAASNSTGAFTYAVTSGPATISGNTITLTGAGTVTLLASEAADANYSAGTKTATFTVAKGAPAITFTVPNHAPTDPPFTVGATSNSTGTFTYSVSSGPATIVGNTVTLTGSGTVVLLASEAADANYNAGTLTATFTVAAGTPTPPTITFGVTGTHTYGDPPFTVAAMSNSTGAFTYSVSSGPATIVGNTVTLTGAGTVTLLASEAADKTYAAGTKTATFTVAAGTPVIGFTVSNHVSTDAPFTVAATSTSTGAFTYIVSSGPATISGSTVTLTGSGTVVLLASEAADANYAAGTKQATFNVTPGSGVVPTISFTAANHTYGDAPFMVAATSNSTGAFTYSVVSGPVTIAGSTVTLTGTGAVVLQASEAADTTYAAGTKTAMFTVSGAILTATASNATRVYGAANPTFTGSVTGQKNGDTFTESFATTATTTSPVGTYSIVPTVAGSNLANYTVSATNGTLTITQGTATLSLTAGTTSGTSVTLNATVVSTTSGTPTGTITILDNGTAIGTATLVNGAVSYTATISGSGAHSLTASYSGDTNFLPSVSSTPPVVPGSATGTDFTFTSTSSNYVTVLGGQTAVFTFSIAPIGGGYPNPVNFSAIGLPTGSTVSFSPSTLSTSGGAQTVVMSVTTPVAHAENRLPNRGQGDTTWLALLLLPLLGGGYRFRRKLGKRGCAMLLLLAGLAGTTALTGCSGGYVGRPNISSIAAIATSGTITHSQSVTLTIE